MEYVGIKDQNGVKIYESDIYIRQPVGDRLPERHIVKFGNYSAGGLDFYAQGAYGFYGESQDDLGDDNSLDEYIAIIGNIHEQPELLGDK